MTQTAKSRKRASLRSTHKLLLHTAERAQFWFDMRYLWSEENGGYEYCRRQFNATRRFRKRLLKNLTKDAGRYLREYVG